MKKFHAILGLCIIGIAIVALLMFKFWIVSANIIGGFLLYFLIDKSLDFFERKGIRGAAAYSLLGILSAVVLLAATLFVALPLIEQTQSLIGQLPQIGEQLHARVTEINQVFPFASQIEEKAKETIFAGAKGLIGISGSIITSVITIIIIAFILLACRNTIHRDFAENIPNEYFEVTVGLTHNINEQVENYVVAKVAETAIITVIHIIGFWMIGLPQPLFMGILAGLLNIIPYLGPLITVIPVGVVALLAGGYPMAAFAMIVLAIAQIIDNAVLQTWLISQFVDIHPLMAVIITLLGGEIGGMIGMIIAIPAYSVAKIIVSGIYSYLKSVQRHEHILRQEESYKQNNAGRNKRQIKANVLSAP